jgi:drug/metabolite transporter (DMT)-like permease
MNRTTAIGIAFGIGAGLAYGVSSVLIKYSVSSLATPLVGASISLFIGTIGMGFFGGRGFKSSVSGNRKGTVFMLLSGAAAACGIICAFFALDMSPVVVVTPLQSTNPLFALLFSYLFLGRLEKIAPRLIAGSVLVVAGVVLITVGRV